MGRLSIVCCLTLLASCTSADGSLIDEDREDGFGATGLECGGFPRARIDTASELCMGIVASSDETGFKPRALLELPNRDNEFLVSSLGNWTPGEGALWYLDARDPDHVRFQPIWTNLSLPHHLQIGPDGRIYMGEDTHISAFPPTAIDGNGVIDIGQVEVVVDGLPPIDANGERNSMHPISQFAFNGDGDVFVNVGAYTDHCAGFLGAECHEVDHRVPSVQREDPHHWGGVIRRYDRIGDAAFSEEYSVVAFGLRNSMGLVFTPNGDLIQVENSRDFREGGRPFEELNVIPRAELDGDAPPKHYGWPYCYDVYETSDEWEGFASFDCSPDNPDYRPPHILLPPHGAPLGLTYYNGDRLPSLTGKLLVPLHGYRPAGQRMMAFDVDASGLPVLQEDATYLVNPERGVSSAEPFPNHDEGIFTSQGEYLIRGWFEVPGFRPKGAPVAPYVSRDGAIWVADDKNKVILRFDAASEPLPELRKENLYPVYQRALSQDPALEDAYNDMVAKVLHSPQCMGCHDDFRLPDDDSRFPELRYLLALGTWVTPGAPETSTLFTKLNPLGTASMPPLGREWASTAEGQDAIDSVRNFITILPTLEPGLNDEWIGGACAEDVDCGFEGATCQPDGFCTSACTQEAPFCPDRDGTIGTFCVAIDSGMETGACVMTCDLDEPQCLEGQSCVARSRFGRVSPVKGVCL